MRKKEINMRRISRYKKKREKSQYMRRKEINTRRNLNM